MTEVPPSHDARRDTQEPESASDRRLGNIVIAVGLVLLFGVAWWLADAMYTARRADDCLSSGRRNCVPIDVPVQQR